MKDDVKNYYGKVLQQSGDLKTDACATAGDIPRYIKDILAQINDEVMTRYYGCGLIAPQALEGCKVLDLGCGSGRDAYVLASLVGESGSVTGVDMTREQMDVALRYIDYHKEQFGYGQAVIYKGGIMHSEQAFTLDNHHVIEKGKIFPVCGNTWRMLKETRFADYFQFIGSFDTHYGIYQDCGTPLPYTSEVNDKTVAGCC